MKRQIFSAQKMVKTIMCTAEKSKCNRSSVIFLAKKNY